MKGHAHRKGSKKHRNGRNRYEKGWRLYTESPKHVVSRYVASGRPLEPWEERAIATLGDVWPKTT